MSTDSDKYALEASMYDQLASYYKYSNPHKYIEYYLKHYEAVQRLHHTYYRVVQPQGEIQPAKVRVLHASPNTQVIDVYINGQNILQNITFKGFSNYLSLPQGQYRIDIYSAGSETVPLLSTILPVKSQYVYTAVTSGEAGKLQLLPFLDSTYVPYNEAHIRFAHLSPDTPAVDVALKDGSVLLSNISFKQISNYLQVSPGKGDLEILVTGTKHIVLSLPDIIIEANKAYTIYAIGYANQAPAIDALFLTN